MCAHATGLRVASAPEHRSFAGIDAVGAEARGCSRVHCSCRITEAEWDGRKASWKAPRRHALKPSDMQESQQRGCAIPFRPESLDPIACSFALSRSALRHLALPEKTHQTKRSAREPANR